MRRNEILLPEFPQREIEEAGLVSVITNEKYLRLLGDLTDDVNNFYQVRRSKEHQLKRSENVIRRTHVGVGEIRE